MTKKKEAKPKFSERVMKQGTLLLVKWPDTENEYEAVVDHVVFKRHGSYYLMANVPEVSSRSSVVVDLDSILQILKIGDGPLIVKNERAEYLKTLKPHRFAVETPEGYSYSTLQSFIYGVLGEFERSWAERGLTKPEQVYNSMEIPPKLLKSFASQMAGVVKGEMIPYPVGEHLKEWLGKDGFHYHQSHFVTHSKFAKLQLWADRNRLKFLTKNDSARTAALRTAFIREIAPDVLEGVKDKPITAI